MCKLPLFAALLIILAVVNGSAQGGSRGRGSDARLIGNVSVPTVAEGCGCYFRAASAGRDSGRYVFFEEAGQEVPLMNIGGAGREAEAGQLDRAAGRRQEEGRAVQPEVRVRRRQGADGVRGRERVPAAV